MPRQQKSPHSSLGLCVVALALALAVLAALAPSVVAKPSGGTCEGDSECDSADCRGASCCVVNMSPGCQSCQRTNSRWVAGPVHCRLCGALGTRVGWGGVGGCHVSCAMWGPLWVCGAFGCVQSRDRHGVSCVLSLGGVWCVVLWALACFVRAAALWRLTCLDASRVVAVL